MGNYIKIDRKILDWEWWHDINTCRVFLFLVLKANWKDSMWKGVLVKRGSYISSLDKLANDTDLTRDEIRTAIKHLKNTKEITTQATRKYTVFTVVNYDLYQDNPTQITTQIPNKSPTIPLLIPSREEEKEGKEIYKQIIDLYNSICVSFSKVTKISDKRKKAIAARLKMYDIEDFRKLFEMAEQSSFLKGGNDRDWSANFDWLIKDSNMAKVLDGNYNAPANKKKQCSRNTRQFEQRSYDRDSLKQLMQNQNKQVKALLDKDKENQ